MAFITLPWNCLHKRLAIDFHHHNTTEHYCSNPPKKGCKTLRNNLMHQHLRTYPGNRHGIQTKCLVHFDPSRF